MNAAIISLTEAGRLISAKTAQALGNAKRYCFHKHTDGNAEAFTDISALTAQIFGSFDALVFISSVGIAVRACAPHLVSKITDPAVVAADDGGKYAVSVLSGHLGGANALAKQVADIIGAVPVITTATDSRGLFSPDIFAKANGLVICDMTAVREVAAAVLDGKKVGFVCAYPHSELPEELTECDSGSIGIRVGGSSGKKPFDTTLELLPKNIVVGIGCKNGTTCDTIISHVMSVFSSEGIDIRRICAVATIDIKKDEPGLREFCERFGLPLMTYTAEELMSAEGDFSHSDFVEKTTGADNVCERAAVCAGGTPIVGKTCGNGVTAAAAELPVFIDAERKDV